MISRRLLFWLLVLTLLTLYSLLVYNWWVEGTMNFERQKAEQQYEDTLPRR